MVAEHLVHLALMFLPYWIVKTTFVLTAIAVFGLLAYALLYLAAGWHVDWAATVALDLGGRYSAHLRGRHVVHSMCVFGFDTRLSQQFSSKEHDGHV